MAFNIKKTYIAKRIIKTSRLKQWLCFFVAIFCFISILLQSLNLLVKPENFIELTNLTVVDETMVEFTPYRITPLEKSTFEADFPNVSPMQKITFHLMQSGEFLPVIGDISKFETPEFYGYLHQFTDEQRQNISEQLIAQGADSADVEGFLQFSYLTVMNPANFDAYYTSLLAAILLWSIYVWAVNRRTKRTPQKHKIFRAFQRKGGELENFHQLNDEFSSGEIRNFKHIQVTENWIFYDGKINLKLRNLEDIVCCYIAKTVENSIITRWATKKKDLVICFIDKKQWNIKLKKNFQMMEELKAALKKRLPNIICGKNDKEIQKLWESRPADIIERFMQNQYHESNQKQIKLSQKVQKEEETANKVNEQEANPKENTQPKTSKSPQEATWKRREKK